MLLRRIRTTAGVLALLAFLVAGCGEEPAPAPPTEQNAAWQQSTDPVDTTGFIWAQGHTAYLADGTTIRTDEPILVFTVAGDGIYYGGSLGGDGQTDMRFASPRGDTATGIATTGFRASPDGRYLAYVDLTTGTKDGYGTPQPNNVVLDLHTGEEIVRSTDGTGDPYAEDYALFLENDGATLDTITNDTAYFYTGGTHYAYDLTTGDGTTVDRNDVPPITTTHHRSLWNPSHTWRIVETKELQDRLVGPEGRQVTPDPGTSRWGFSEWIDDTTVFGSAIEGPGSGAIAEGDRITVMTCKVPSGACDLVPGSEHTLADVQAGEGGVVYPNEPH